MKASGEEVMVPSIEQTVLTQIEQAVETFERQFMAGDPGEVRAGQVDDLIVIRLSKISIVAERTLCRTPEGRALVKQMWTTLFEQGRQTLTAKLSKITGMELRAIFSDFDPLTDEAVLMFSSGRQSSV